MRLRVAGATAASLLGAVALAACGGAQGDDAAAARPASLLSARAVGSASGGSQSQPCGAAAPEAFGRAVALVAKRIYTNELASTEVFRDRHQVEGFAPLVGALARGDRAAAREAVNSLVFSHTHIVRLRVSAAGGQIVADIGGPWVLAPVSGTLRSGGKTVGRYVLSVQDDSGYVKLAARFLGARVLMSTGSRALPVEGAIADAAPASMPALGTVRYRNSSYEAFTFDAQAFPSGTLRTSVLVPLPSQLTSRSCSAVAVAELGEVARRVSQRFALSASDLSSYIKVTTALTHGLVYVRSGTHQLAASSPPGPRRLPEQGTVGYRGITYGVYSFAAPTGSGPVRVYQLVHP